MGIQLPTEARLMSSPEYRIVSQVFGDTLPSRERILVTNAAGINGRASTIPTSLVTVAFGVNLLTLLQQLIGGYLRSAINAGYLMNRGRYYGSLATSRQYLLVHETAHVWQGKNSIFALSYVFNSIWNQGIHGSKAYHFVPGSPWGDYNAEQQASIIEQWFVSGQPTSGALYPYIVNHVRKGDA